MSEENVEVVRRGIDAFNRRDLEEVLRDYDPDVEVDWSRSRGVQAGIYRGHAAARRFLNTFYEGWDRVHVVPEEFIEHDEDVCVPNRARFRGRDGIEVEASSAWVVTLRNGRIVRFRLYPERVAALKAVGLED